MLSNFEIDGSWKEIQKTMQKVVRGQAPGAPPGRSRKGSGRVPEASGEPPERVREAAGEAGGPRAQFLTKFCVFLQNSGPVLGGQIGAKSDKNR